MKKINVLAAAGLLMLSSCDLDINQDPNYATGAQITPELQFPSVISGRLLPFIPLRQGALHRGFHVFLPCVVLTLLLGTIRISRHPPGSKRPGTNPAPEHRHKTVIVILFLAHLVFSFHPQCDLLKKRQMRTK